MIGLPRKKLKLTKKTKRPRSFDSLLDFDKCAVMLSWFVEKDVVEKCMKNRSKIGEECIECDASKVFLAALDAPLELFQEHLEEDAWIQVQSTVEQMRTSGRQWLCKVCEQGLETRFVGCDSCLCWLHYHCAGIKQKPKGETWFCNDCKEDYKYM